MKEIIINLLKKEGIKLRDEELGKLIEIPPSPELGDYSLPCFFLAKKEKKSPDKIAEHLSQKIKLPKEIEKIENKGVYLNFFLNKKILAQNAVKINANFGRLPVGKGKKIVIDFSAPNVGKPMHIGHIRSTILGDSLIRIYNFLGYNPIGVNYLGDIGLHIGKLIVAYELWLDRDALKKNPVQELLRLYVMFCNKEKSKITEGVEEEFQNNEWTNRAKEKLKLLELGDKKTEKIWNEIRKASEKGFNKVYEMLNINFNETVGQSEFSEHGKKIVLNAVLKKLAKSEKDGAVYVEIDSQKKFILRSNQTSSYITYDLGAAVERYKKYNFDRMIYVTDSRQADHFNKLFKILSMFGYDFSEKLTHLGFGTIKFDNEIIATRKGDIILLEDVLKKTIAKAEKEIKKRKTKGDAEKVGVGAIKYIVLKTTPQSDVHFSWESALNFEGDSGPYLQYSYARASSIIKKAGKFNKSKIKISGLVSAENNLVKKILLFPEIVKNAQKELNPAIIANYSFELAKLFNEFYHSCPVINSDNESFRLLLVDSFRTTLKNALYLLGIEVADEM
ncbi:arginine--tRNA ligase [Candidatus Pacearchaeota archaeon RBG_19FT_COMBO_34_9]|nr:MAG: arginine--tRNA ligase [Candidatus Pacearchaeota archaeon RBG_19FT_COMBO_34_9]OGJ16749.1 MAG: arginine--tRNA ligase [Candidatus Pacearchaeota archaeon RBG_13_33_26]